MGFFDSLFRKPDPTRDWPSGSGTPSVNPASRSLGFVRLGDSLDAARTLGRPDRFVRHGEGFYTLSYASRGFAIEFEEGRLVEIACFIGPGGATPSDPPPAFVRPTLPAGRTLGPETTVADVIAELGEPQTRDESDEPVLTYVSGGVAQEFYFDERGRLQTWSVYLD